MKLAELKESKISGAKAHTAMKTMVSYIQRKMGSKLIKVPGIEHFHNSLGHGFGYRYIINGSTDCIRFNWSSEPKAGETAEITSIDIFTGKHDPTFSVHTRGLSLVKALPALVTVLKSPALGRVSVFPVDAEEALSEQVTVFEAKRDDFTAEEAVADFLKKLSAGKTFTRSEFIGSYHIVHAGIFDTVFKDFKDKFQIDAKRVAIKPGTTIQALKDSIMSKAGVLEVTSGGAKEVYLKTKQEEQVEAASPERIPYGDVLEHLEGLVTGIVKGAFNALFVAGKGGSLSGSTSVNIIDSNSKDIDDNNKAKDAI